MRSLLKSRHSPPIWIPVEAETEEIAKAKTVRRRTRRAKVAKQETAAKVEASDKMTHEPKTESLPDETKSRDEAEAPADQKLEEVVDEKAAIELWRFRETGRFEVRDEVFQGFESPPGRF
ncbi:MAG TPA: hypothetical protein VMR52_03750 [Dehalococcoidia bacterium]|nr:hypothetical protein [Dehalococcoidia bacterium]